MLVIVMAPTERRGNKVVSHKRDVTAVAVTAVTAVYQVEWRRGKKRGLYKVQPCSALFGRKRPLPHREGDAVKPVK